MSDPTYAIVHFPFFRDDFTDSTRPLANDWVVPENIGYLFPGDGHMYFESGSVAQCTIYRPNPITNGSVEVRALQGNNMAYAGPFVRAQTVTHNKPTSGYQLCVFPENINLISIMDMEDSSDVSARVPYTYNAGDVLRIEAIGDTINGYVNDELIVSGTSSKYASGYGGFVYSIGYYNKDYIDLDYFEMVEV